MPGLIKSFINVANPTGAEPVPNSALMSDTQDAQIKVLPGKTYLLRIVNIGAFAAQHFWIEGHSFRIVEADGVWTEPTEADMIYITAAQRYGVLLTTRNETASNFAIVGNMDQDLFDKVPLGLNPNVTSYLVYNSSMPMPEQSFVESFHDFDDMALIPIDHEELFKNVQYSFTLDVKMGNLGNGANYAFFNDITYVRPKVPTLYTALTTGETSTNAAVYGANTNTFVLRRNEVIEIVLNNRDRGKHPFHLHGHNFQAVARGEESSQDYNPANATFPAVPMRRDVLLAKPYSHIVMRFRADNPGVWLFHCHIEWHVDSGLIATIVEVCRNQDDLTFPGLTCSFQAPLEMQKNVTIPGDHYAACAASLPPVPTAGNAAARTIDLLNLDGAYVAPAPLPVGFTSRGIVALTFSIVAALLGIATISWYGMGELSAAEFEHTKRRIASAGEKVLDDLIDSTDVTLVVQ